MSRLYKRLIGILLIIAIGFSSVGFVNAEDTTGMSKNVSEAMEFLKLLEIIPDYDEFNLDVTDEVKRADFAAAVAKLLNCGSFKGSGIYYYDVAQTYWAYNEIAFLTEKGILNGNGNKLFRPDDIIEKSEAYKMLLTALGYGEYAEYNGGFPYGYLLTAKRAGLDDGLTAGQPLTMGDMILLLYNTAAVPLFEATAFKGDFATYTVSDKHTLLTESHNIYCAEEIVNCVDGVSISSVEYDKDTVVIGDEKYNTEMKLEDYLGHKVRIFYRYDKAKEDRKILWIKKLDEALEITVDNDASFDAVSFVLTYYPEGSTRARKVTLDRGIKVVYNGEIFSENLKDIFSLAKYDLKLIERDGKYMVAVVNYYRNLVIGSIDNIGLTVYDKVDTKHKRTLNENIYDVLQIKDASGNVISFDKLAVGNVLSYSLSPDERKLKVCVSTEQITGRIDAMTENNDKFILTVNSVDYQMPKSVNIKKVKGGDNVVLYLDIKGDVAYADVTDNTTFAAYLIDGEMTDKAFNSEPRFRMLTADGVKYLDGNKKITIDGQRLNAAEVLKLLSENNSFVSQFAMIGTNKDGKVNTIDTITTNKALEGVSYLRQSIPYSDTLYFKQNGTLGRKGTTNDKTVFFSIPAENVKAAQDDKFSVLAKKDIVDAVNISGESYKTAERIGYEQFVVIKGYLGDMIGKENPILVTDIVHTMNDEGEIVELVEGFQGGVNVSVTAAEGFSFINEGIEAGDIIRFNKTPKGEIYKLHSSGILFDYSNPASLKDNNIDSYHTSNVGYVYDIVDGVVKIGFTKPTDTTKYEDYDFSIAVSGKPVLICETVEGEVRVSVGNINDAKSWYNEKNGDTCSMIYTFQKNCTTEFVVIYR